MTAKQSTKAKKPRKPYPAYPLRAHDNGQWVKKIRGVVRCCGVWSDPAAALKVYKANRVYWETGTTPKDQEPEGLTVKRAMQTQIARRLWILFPEAFAPNGCQHIRGYRR